MALKRLNFLVISLTLFHIFNTEIKAQSNLNNRIDSIEQILNNTKNIKNQLDLFIELSWMYRKVNASKAIIYSDSTINLARKYGKHNILWIGLNSKAEALRLSGNLEKSFKIHQDALKIAESYNLIQKKAHSLNNIGLILKRQKNYKSAKEYILKSRDIYLSINDTVGLITTSTNLGNCITNIEDYDEALTYYNEVIKLATPKNDLESISDALTNIGHCYYYMNKKEQAKQTYYKGLLLREKLGIPSTLADSYYNYGYMLFEDGNIEIAKEYAKKALKITKPTGDKDNLIDLYSFFSEIAIKENNYKEAYFYSDTMRAYKDSVIDKNNIQSLNEMAQKFESEKKQLLIENLEKEKTLKEKENKQQKLILILITFALIISASLGTYTLILFKEKTRANKIISHQKNAIEEKQKEILDSIYYAKRIQQSLLAHNDLLNSNLKQFFVFFQPKDIVSGDFYWASKKDNKFYLAVCDSTGHGIPGAFMSLLNISFLNEAVNEKNIEEPNEILNFVRSRLITNVNKDGQKDGFDGTLICVDYKRNYLTYSAAYNPLILVRDNKLIELNYDRMPVGISDINEGFKLNEIQIKQNDNFYLYTDGFPDQFGGESGKKYKYKRLNDLILKIHNKSMNEQNYILNNELNQWKGNLEQIDDVCILGFRIA